MIGVEHGILPHEKAVKDRGDKGVEEERRLCYVGFTRARKVLRVTWCEKRQHAFSRGKTARFLPSAPSRFLMESGLMSRDEYLAAAKVASEARAPRGIRATRPAKSPAANSK
jgi:superfamily I DNA/RNA helicase